MQSNIYYMYYVNDNNFVGITIKFIKIASNLMAKLKILVFVKKTRNFVTKTSIFRELRFYIIPCISVNF